MEEYLAEIRHLKIEYETEYGRVHAVNDVSFPIYREQITGLVGESGSGKSMTALAIMGLLPQGRRTVEGEIRYQGQNLLTLEKGALPPPQSENRHDFSEPHVRPESGDDHRGTGAGGT